MNFKVKDIVTSSAFGEGEIISIITDPGAQFPIKVQFEDQTKVFMMDGTFLYKRPNKYFDIVKVEKEEEEDETSST